LDGEIGFSTAVVCLLILRSRESGVSKDEADIGALMVLLAMQSIVQ
jgi:hypothetical protein